MHLLLIVYHGVASTWLLPSTYHRLCLVFGVQMLEIRWGPDQTTFASNAESKSQTSCLVQAESEPEIWIEKVHLVQVAAL